MCFHDKKSELFFGEWNITFWIFFLKIIEMLELWRWYQVITSVSFFIFLFWE